VRRYQFLSRTAKFRDSLYRLLHPPTLLFHKQCQRRRVAVKEALFAYRTDFAVAEESSEAHRAEALLDHRRIMVGLPEKALTSAIATAQATAIDLAAAQLLPSASEEFLQVLRGCGP